MNKQDAKHDFKIIKTEGLSFINLTKWKAFHLPQNEIYKS